MNDHCCCRSTVTFKTCELVPACESALERIEAERKLDHELRIQRIIDWSKQGEGKGWWFRFWSGGLPKTRYTFEQAIATINQADEDFRFLSAKNFVYGIMNANKFNEVQLSIDDHSRLMYLTGGK